MKAGGPAHMKADLRRRMKSYPCHMEEIVEHTPTEGVFLNHIGDRLASPQPASACRLPILPPISLSGPPLTRHAYGLLVSLLSLPIRNGMHGR